MAGSSLLIDAVQACYATWKESRGRDCEGFLGLMADEIEMRSVLDPALPDDLAADRKSLDEARQYFDVLSRDWDMIDFPQERLVADGDTIVFIGIERSVEGTAGSNQLADGRITIERSR